jgi:F-type H+-transporting ATPase subunit b
MLIMQLIVIQVVTFIALVFVMRKIMYSASMNETRRLQVLNEENSKKAQELALKIEDAQRQYRDKIALAENEIAKLKAQAKEDAVHLKEDILSKARQEAERIVAQALSSRQEIRLEIEAEMKEAGIEQSLGIIMAVLSSDNLRHLHETCLKEAIIEIEKIDGSNFRVTTSEGELVTPYEIDRETKEKIAGLLSGKADKKIVLREKIDRQIVAGITVKLGSMIIDGSLGGKLKEARYALMKG